MSTITGQQQQQVSDGGGVPGAQSNSAQAAPAAGGWFNFAVNMTGPAEDGNIYIHLRELDHSAFDRWYSAVPGMKREMLATALTAITTGKSCSALLTSTDEYGVINRLYVRTV